MFISYVTGVGLNRVYIAWFFLQGTITKCLLPEAGVYELDGRIILYLTHLCLCNLGRGLRSGNEVEVHHAHVLKITAPQWKVSA